MNILVALIMSFITIFDPVAATNQVLNPVGGAAGSFSGQGGITITRVTTEARFGLFSYSVPILAANDGIDLTLSTLANAIHFVTFYVHGTIASGTLDVSLNSGTNTDNAILLNGPGDATGWSRYGVQISAARSNGSTRVDIEQVGAGAGTILIDGVQVEQSTFFTTLVYGDQQGSFTNAYRWTGLKHGSTSTRSAQERDGGRERDLVDDFSVNPISYRSIGMPPVTLNMEPLALQPGAIHQSTKLRAREATYEFQIDGTSYADMQQLRQGLVDLIKPHRVRGDQAFTLGFKNDVPTITSTAYARYRYQSGLEITDTNGFTETMFLPLVAVDADFFADDRGTDSFDFRDQDTDADFAMARINGAWTALGTGMNAVVHALAYDKERGRVYIAGDFTTANGVAANRIAYWNGTTFVAMGSGANADVRAIKIAPNGDVWIGGDFTTAGGAAADGLAKWDISAGSWVQFTNGTPGDVILGIDIDSTGRIYIGGNFQNWDGVAAADFLAQSTDDGATWTALGTGSNGQVNTFAIDSADNLYLGGAFTTVDGVSATRLAKWDGSNITALGSGANNNVSTLRFGLDGLLYIGGNFTDAGSFITSWDGSAFQTLGVGVNNAVFSIDITQSGIVLVGGGFTTAGGIDVADRFAGWNGSSWFPWDIDLPGSPTTNAVLSIENGDIFIGYTTSGTATIAGSTTATNGGTAKVSPVITIIGPTTANTVVTFKWLENQSTGERLYFNMSVNTDEIITIDTRPGSVGIFSSFRDEITDNPLPPGGLSLFELLPGDNVIAAFMTGTTTGAEVLIHWDIKHISVDGLA